MEAPLKNIFKKTINKKNERYLPASVPSSHTGSSKEHLLKIKNKKNERYLPASVPSSHAHLPMTAMNK